MLSSNRGIESGWGESCCWRVGGGGYMLDDGVGHGKLIKNHKEPHWLEVKDTTTLSRYPLWVIVRVWPLA